MVKINRVIALFTIALSSSVGWALTEEVDGIVWHYEVRDDVAILYNQVAVPWMWSPETGQGYMATACIDTAISGKINIPATLGGFPVAEVGSMAFANCSNITEIVFSSVTNFSPHTFEHCTSMTKITIPPEMSRVPEYCFCSCTNLMKVEFTHVIKSIGACAFAGCTSLSEIVLPEEILEIGPGAFRKCAITNVTLPCSLREVGTEKFDGAVFGTFDRCFNLRSVLICSTNVNLGGPEQGCFQNCTNLTSVTFAGVNCDIGDSCFSGCSALKRIDLTNSVIKAIGAGCFSGCKSLTKFRCPGVKVIKTSTFSGCSNLEEVWFDDGVEVIECSSGVFGTWTFVNSTPFDGCQSLKRIVVPKTCTNIVSKIAVGRGVVSDSVSGMFDGCPNADVYFSCPLNEQIVHDKLITSIADIGLTPLHTRLFVPAASWIKVLGLNSFYGFVYDFDESALGVNNSVLRESSPMNMDETYQVSSTSNGVSDVRAIAFVDGERNLSKLIRVETFAGGTETNVGDRIAANVEHTISWSIPGDYAENVANLQMEVLAKEGSLLQLELVEIPANGSNEAMEFSWNTYTADQVFNALLWLYASKAEGLTLENGAFKYDGKTLASGTGLSDAAAATSYVLKTMGFDTMTAADVAYVKAQTGMELQPSGVRQYGVRRGASIGTGTKKIGNNK